VTIRKYLYIYHLHFSIHFIQTKKSYNYYENRNFLLLPV
jgi:hypothetical protein